MNRFQKYYAPLAASGAMVMLILDSKTAIDAAAQAIELCVRTAIPSLFPFFVLSGILVPYASHLRVPFLGRLLSVPEGWESIFLLGCLGGYPVGAQCVAQGYATGKLDENQAQRMLGFCTNCGPSFLFGIVGSAFAGNASAFAITLIGILSAVTVGMFWPTEHETSTYSPEISHVSLPQAIRQAVRSMSSVCAWIILGKILLTFLSKWFLGQLPSEAQLGLTGILELTNGCLMLNQCADEQMRFILACAITSFGGICVMMQVWAICHDAKLATKCYLPQKALQAVTAAGLATAYVIHPGAPLVLVGIGAILWILQKKTVEIPKSVVYNGANKGGI